MIHLIGVSDGELPKELNTILPGCNSIVLSKRFAGLYKEFFSPSKSIEIIPIAPLSGALDTISQKISTADVAVLASGDPLFFGIGKMLCHRFGSERVKIYPALSSMQLAFARFKINWDDATFLSLHGRKDDQLFLNIIQHKKLCLLTDSHNSPDKIAAKIIGELGHKQAAKYVVHIAEDIGTVNEKLTTGSLVDISTKTFSSLNVVILINKEVKKDKSIRFGLLEQEIQHSRGLITKNEIRAVALHKLRLADKGVLWDIGAGSGSVSVEAARLFPELHVYSIEKEPAQIENLKWNKNRYCCWNMTIIELPDLTLTTVIP